MADVKPLSAEEKLAKIRELIADPQRFYADPYGPETLVAKIDNILDAPSSEPKGDAVKVTRPTLKIITIKGRLGSIWYDINEMKEKFNLELKLGKSIKRRMVLTPIKE